MGGELAWGLPTLFLMNLLYIQGARTRGPTAPPSSVEARNGGRDLWQGMRSYQEVYERDAVVACSLHASYERSCEAAAMASNGYLMESL